MKDLLTRVHNDTHSHLFYLVFGLCIAEYGIIEPILHTESDIYEFIVQVMVKHNIDTLELSSVEIEDLTVLVFKQLTK